ncbi:MAG: 50S ribosomal protein L1, partial [Candidatus Nanohaloarchaeota archaeon]|nr:50S ribosomal protein L1 [Candidatus Nanohaloarchaeota archaeon]
MKIQEAIKYLQENSKKRNFNQAIDLIVNIKGVNLKQPENRFVEEVYLPAKLSKPRKVMVIGDVIASKAKGIADVVLTKDELMQYTGDKENKKKFKKLIKNVDYLIAEAPLMVIIGKEFGRILGSRGKMPKPLPPNADPKPIIERLKNTVRVKLKDVPLIQTVIGYEDMKTEDIVKNYDAVMSTIV